MTEATPASVSPISNAEDGAASTICAPLPNVRTVQPALTAATATLLATASDPSAQTASAILVASSSSSGGGEEGAVAEQSTPDTAEVAVPETDPALASTTSSNEIPVGRPAESCDSPSKGLTGGVGAGAGTEAGAGSRSPALPAAAAAASGSGGRGGGGWMDQEFPPGMKSESTAGTAEGSGSGSGSGSGAKQSAVAAAMDAGADSDDRPWAERVDDKKIAKRALAYRGIAALALASQGQGQGQG